MFVRESAGAGSGAAGAPGAASRALGALAWGREVSACVPCPGDSLPSPALQSERFGGQRGFPESQMSRCALVCIRVTPDRLSRGVSPVTGEGQGGRACAASRRCGESYPQA